MGVLHPRGDCSKLEAPRGEQNLNRIFFLLITNVTVEDRREGRDEKFRMFRNAKATVLVKTFGVLVLRRKTSVIRMINFLIKPKKCSFLLANLTKRPERGTKMLVHVECFNILFPI